MRKLSQDSFLTTAEVARYLGFSTRTITTLATAWQESGGTEGIPAIKVGKRHWRFDPEQVEDYVRKLNPAAHTVIAETMVASRKFG